ncbi:MAG: DHH family phosphoesterase [Actinobacteria bacterium]|nr:DHH family phosphoesterase [Actinomycetota bacterium]
MTIPEAEWARAVAVLTSSAEVALACHVDPDGDALGSLLALRRFLDGRGVATAASWGAAGEPAPLGRVTTARGDGGAGTLTVPPQYTFLPGLDALMPVAEFPAAPEVLVCLDTGTPQRLGSLGRAARAARTVVVLDHHECGDAFGDVRLVDPAAAATAVLVDELVGRMGGRLDAAMAECLYVGLVTDTGRFQHSSTTPEVMRLGARLLSHGLDASRINRQVWETHSFGYVKVLSRVLDRATLVPSVGLAWTAVLQRDLDECGIAAQETEGLNDVLRAVEVAEVTLVAKECPGGSWKVSLRSRGGVNVGDVAARLGGGGHAFAAGFTDEGPVEGVVHRVRRVLDGLTPAAGPRRAAPGPPAERAGSGRA